jgi:putative transposase
MDGKGRFLDNIFIERLWRSLKYEEVFIKAYGSIAEARRGIGSWISFYNDERLHQALNYQTPSQVFAQAKACGHMDNATGVDHMPTVEQQQQLIRITSIAEEGRKGIHFLS